MSLIQHLFGNATEVDPAKIQAEFVEILISGESITQCFKLFRDLLILSNYRLIVVNKQGMTGSKQEIVSIPWKNIKKFSCENAGFLDGDGELKVWVTGDQVPMKWELSKTINIRQVYAFLSHYVLSA